MSLFIIEALGVLLALAGLLWGFWKWGFTSGNRHTRQQNEQAYREGYEDAQFDNNAELAGMKDSQRRLLAEIVVLKQQLAKAQQVIVQPRERALPQSNGGVL